MQWMDEGLKWMAIHPVRVDLLVVAAVAGTVALILRRQRRQRRMLHRMVWAMHLKRKDLERLHLMRFEDALTDAAFEMVARGEMTEKQEKEWYAFFAENYGMKGMLPPPRTQATVKKALKTRWWHRQKQMLIGKYFPTIPGPKPAEGLKVDETYDPTPIKLRSKYVREE